MKSPDVQRQQVLGEAGGLKLPAALMLFLAWAVFLPASAPGLEAEGGSGQSFAVAIPELDGPVTLGIFSKDGTPIRLLQRDAPVDTIPAGLNGLILIWDGKDDQGRPVPPGTYRARGLVHGPMKVTSLPLSAPQAPATQTKPPMVPDFIPHGAGEPQPPVQALMLPAAADALYEQRPQVALLPRVSGRTVTLMVNGLPLLDLPSGNGEITSAAVTQGAETGAVTVTLRGSSGEKAFTVTGLGQLVPLEAGTLEIRGDAFLSPAEHKE